MWRSLTLAALLLFGLAAVAEAQPYDRPPGPAAPGSAVDGTWYYQGDPTTPCSIQTVPGLALKDCFARQLGRLQGNGRV